jgi:ribonuclease HI
MKSVLREMREPMSDPAVLTIHIDGAARGNPGPAACAFVITQDGAPPLEEAECLGSATNNVAEYTALLRALQRAAELGGRRLLVRSDSELLVKQMNGLYRVKNEQLRDLYDQAKRLCARFDSVSITHVPRSANSEADRLCNEVLDGVRTSTAFRSSPTSTEGRARATPKATVEERALGCLRAAAATWAQGEANTPSPEVVWDQLRTILEEGGLLRPARAPKSSGGPA